MLKQSQIVFWKYAVQMMRILNTTETVFQFYQGVTGIITSTYPEVVMLNTKSFLLIKQ